MIAQSNIWKGLGISVAFVFLISCAPRHSSGYFTSGKNVALPDSARVKAVVSVSQENLSAVLFAVPNERYRLELSGTFGLSAASILWKKDGWKVVLPHNDRYMEGVGDCVSILGYGNVDIHKFAKLFLGRRVDALDCNGSVLTLEYERNTALAVFGGDSLKLEIKTIDPKAKWGGGVWNLNVPEKYIRITEY